MGKGPVGRWGVNFGNFYGGGGKIFFIIFSFLRHFADFFAIFAIFIILSFQFEIFMGSPHRQLIKIFMMGGQFKVHDGGTPIPPVPISGARSTLNLSL